METMSKHCGPGYASPLDAMKNGPRENILYVICIQPDSKKGSDFLATIDVDPKSSTYCKIIHTLHTGNLNDELHHCGWNVCSSCFKTEPNRCRDKLIMPCLKSSNVYVVDTSEPKSPKLFKTIPGSEMYKLGCATPHTTHCLPTGEIMISTMGDPKDEGKGEFVLIDSKTLKMTGTWTKGKEFAKFGYDFWYQPKFDVCISSEWGAPRVFKRGFSPSDVVSPNDYGRSLNIFSWKKRELKQVINLGTDGLAPLEVRFLHNPNEAQGYVGCAVNANIFRFFQKPDKSWDAEKVISIPPKEVSNWVLPQMSGLITDIIISLDDRFLYFSCWLHGDVRQYDITDRRNPKLTDQIFLGGLLTNGSPIKVVNDPEGKVPRDKTVIKGKTLYGGPQMLQLSLDGKRLYVTSSLFSPWDKQFYPDMVESGAWMVQIDCDVANGGMKLNKNFLVDFGNTSDGPVLAHEVRYPGGDCTSDIWLADDACCESQ